MKRILFLALSLLGFLKAEAQLPVDPALKQLIADAIAYFPKLKEVELAHQVGEQRLDIARSAYYPNVSLNASYLYVDPVSEATFPVGQNQFRNLKFQPNNNLNAGVGFNYPVLDFGRAMFFVKKANEELQQSRLAVELNKAQLAAQVSSIYYSLAYFRQAVAIEDSVLGYLNANRNLIDSRVKNGDALQLDLLTVQSTISQEENRKADMQNFLKKQINLLQYTANKTDVASPGDYNFPSVTSTADDAIKMIEGNYEYKMAESRIRAQEMDIKLNRSNQYPVISINGAAGYRNGYQPEIDDMVLNGQAGVTLSAPIFNGSKARNSVKLSMLQLKQSEQGLEAVKNNYVRDINQAFADVDAANAHLVNIETQIVQANAANRIAASRYANGTGTHVDVLNAISNVQRALLAKANYQYQLCIAHIELARVTGAVYY